MAMRYGSQKRRATTQKTYAMDKDYNKCLKDAKRIHRHDNTFFIHMERGFYTSVSLSEYKLNKAYHGMQGLEHWYFSGSRWVLYGS